MAMLFNLTGIFEIISRKYSVYLSINSHKWDVHDKCFGTIFYARPMQEGDRIVSPYRIKYWLPKIAK
jgi:hypothetical protein